MPARAVLGACETAQVAAAAGPLGLPAALCIPTSWVLALVAVVVVSHAAIFAAGMCNIELPGLGPPEEQA